MHVQDRGLAMASPPLDHPLSQRRLVVLVDPVSLALRLRQEGVGERVRVQAEVRERPLDPAGEALATALEDAHTRGAVEKVASKKSAERRHILREQRFAAGLDEVIANRPPHMAAQRVVAMVARTSPRLADDLEQSIPAKLSVAKASAEECSQHRRNPVSALPAPAKPRPAQMQEKQAQSADRCLLPTLGAGGHVLSASNLSPRHGIQLVELEAELVEEHLETNTLGLHLLGDIQLGSPVTEQSQQWATHTPEGGAVGVEVRLVANLDVLP